MRLAALLSAALLLSACGGGLTGLRADAARHCARARVLAATGPLGAALDRYERARRAAAAVDDLPQQVAALLGAGAVLAELEQAEAAARARKQALELARASGQPRLLRVALASAAASALAGGDPGAALARLDEAGRLGPGADGEAAARLDLRGLALARARRHREARAAFDRAVARAGDPVEEPAGAAALLHRGALARQQGDLAGARRDLEAALAADKAAGRPAGVAADLEALAHLARAEGDTAKAEGLASRALAAHRARGALAGVRRTLALLADLAATRGDAEAGARDRPAGGRP